MLVDRERLVLLLRRRLLEKASWGQRELLGLVTELEAECTVDEEEKDRAIRLLYTEMEETLYGRFSQAQVARPAHVPAAGPDVMDQPTDHRHAEEASWKAAPQLAQTISA